MLTDSVHIVLSHPQMGENIGAAARAMCNFGLRNLHLVNPRDAWPNSRAIDMSSGAFDHMPEPQIASSLSTALSDHHFVFATTARRRDMVKPVFTPQAAAKEAQQRIASGEQIAFVFGGERAGMTNDEIAQCNAIINIPTNPDFSSLNLGQAVLLVVSQLYLASDETPGTALERGDSAPVSHEEFDNFFGRLEEALDTADFFKAEGLRPTMLRNIRNIFSRADLTEQEIRTLHGMLTALIKH